MERGCPWPQLAGEGRVSLEDAQRVVREAKVGMASCEARLDAAQGYIRVLTGGE